MIHKKEIFERTQVNLYLCELVQHIKHFGAAFERLHRVKEYVFWNYFKTIIVVYPVSFNNYLEVKVQKQPLGVLQLKLVA